MKNNNLIKKKKTRNPINNFFFWIFLWCFWTSGVMITFPFTFTNFNSLKNYYWWWIVVGVIIVVGIIMFVFWFKNFKACKAQNILKEQAKMK